MKAVRESTMADYDDWLALAREIEPLFGPMVEDASFCEGLERAITERCALCVSEWSEEQGRSVFCGGVVVSKEANEILWLAVTREGRRHGLGAILLTEAIDCLDRNRPIAVTTFARTIEAGLPARRLYRRRGFRDSAEAGFNPAGIPVVTMILAEQTPPVGCCGPLK